MNPEQSLQSTPSAVAKVFFWLLLGAFSVFFAEVVVASDPYPFLHVWGLLVVIPLYTLHILVLGRIAFQAPKLSFGLLFLLGAAFGLYEAYITKVIWDPPWGPMYYLGGIAPVQTVVLALWWHPWMAFIVPLLVAETFLTSSREIAGTFFPWLRSQLLKPLHRNWIALLFMVFCGFIESSNAPTFKMSILSFFSTGIVIGGMIMLWRLITWGKHYSMRSLMPQGEQFWVLAVLLAGMYGFLGRTLNTESMGSITGQAVVIASYLLLALLVIFEIRASRKTQSPDTPAHSWSLTRFLATLMIIIAAAVDSHIFLGEARVWIIPLAWLFGGISGIIIFIWVAYRSFIRQFSSEEISNSS